MRKAPLAFALVCASAVVVGCSSRVRGPGGGPIGGALDLGVLDLSMPRSDGFAPLDLSAQNLDLASSTTDLGTAFDFSVTGTGRFFGHSYTQLYRIETSTGTIVDVGPFVDDSFSHQPLIGGVEDIAIDHAGVMFGIGYGPTAMSPLYHIDYTTLPGKAVCREIPMSAPVPANGLTFVPAGMLDPNKEVLLASGTNWWRIDLDAAFTVGTVTTLGDLPSGWMSVGGDAVGIIGDAVYTTARPIAGGTSHLLVLDPQTMTVTDRGDTGQEAFWGLAYWGGVLFGFSYGPINPPYGGKIFALNPQNGQATQLTTMGISPEPQWFGAAVQTSAPRMPSP